MGESVAISTTFLKSNDDSGSRASSRLLSVLLAFTGPENDRGVNEIARKLCIERARVYRYVTILREKGFVSHKAYTHRYFLGGGILQLSQIIARQYDLNAAATPYLERMRDISGEGCLLATRVGSRRSQLLQVESEYKMCQRFQTGVSLPIHLGAGLCLAVFSNAYQKVGEIAAELTVHDNKSNNKAKALGGVLSKTSQLGNGSRLDQYLPKSRSLATAVWSVGGDLSTLVISRPFYRFTKDKVHDVILDLKQCASDLTSRLGGSKFVTTWSLKEG